MRKPCCGEPASRRRCRNSAPSLRSASRAVPRVRSIRSVFPLFFLADAANRPLGKTGPVVRGGVFYQKTRTLICADPLTGRVNWSRTDFGQGADVFGDEEYVLVVPPEGGEATLLATLDGRRDRQTVGAEPPADLDDQRPAACSRGSRWTVEPASGSTIPCHRLPSGPRPFPAALAAA